MMNEEAIKRLKEARTTIQPYRYVNEAIDYAIKALEQQPCEDCISRQAVINAIANTCFWLSADNWEELIKCINSISPINSSENPNKWIPVSERLPKEEGQYLVSTCQNCIDTCFFYNDDGYLWVDYEDSVIAWMPLPSPYKEENNDADN